MSNTAPKQFKGRLTPAQAAAGMNLANRNASRLLEDAEALFKLGRYPTAAALAALSIEEAGKSSILRWLAAAPDDAALKDGWKRYRSHRAKNGQWIVPSRVLSGARRLQDFRDVVDPEAEHTELLDRLKQVAVYTDCFNDCHWSYPDVVGKEAAEGLIFSAGIVSRKTEVTVREMELWVECISRHPWGSSSGYIEWQAAMVKEGLSPKEMLEEAMRFVEGLDTDTLGDNVGGEAPPPSVN